MSLKANTMKIDQHENVFYPRFGWGMIALAAAIWGMAWLMVSCLNFAAARQVNTINKI